MRKGQVRRELGQLGPRFTKQELVEACGLSAKTFDTIRKAARVKGPGHGGMNWEFSADDVKMLIHRAASGSFSERGGAAVEAWQNLLREAGVKLDQNT
jgi:hypothetical protein